MLAAAGQQVAGLGQLVLKKAKQLLGPISAEPFEIDAHKIRHLILLRSGSESLKPFTNTSL